MKHDCPWCGISLKWRFLRSKPLQRGRQILPLFATAVCPECGKRISLCKPKEKNHTLKWSCYALTFGIWVVYKWTGNKAFGYISLALYVALTIIYVISQKYSQTDDTAQKYCKYEDRNTFNP